MKALVIGGTGFIGRHVVRALEARSVFLVEESPDVVVHMRAMGDGDVQRAPRAERLVVISSGDVYLAYGRLIGLEPGDPLPMPLAEGAPLRNIHFPYASHPKYEKLIVEEQTREAGGVVLRLAKVYGPGARDNFVGTHMARGAPWWRWTHVYVENVAHAIALAATHPAASGVYNVGEPSTPTVAERLAQIPPLDVPLAAYDYRQGNSPDSKAARISCAIALTLSRERARASTVAMVANLLSSRVGEVLPEGS